MTAAAGVYQHLRPLMFSIAYRMLSSVSEAEDIVQEAFLRYHRAQSGQAAGAADRSGERDSAEVARLLDGLARQIRQAGVEIRPAEINGQPGALFLDRAGALVNIFALDIAGGQVQVIRSVINPDKLRHLGPNADVPGLRRE